MTLSLEMIWTWVAVSAVKLAAAGLVFIIGRWLAGYLAKLLAKRLERGKTEVTVANFLKNIVYYSLLTVVVIAALAQLGISTTSFLTIVGAAGLAIGLALKDSLGNFASGVMLVLFRPFKVGDFVTAAGMSGTVREISIFHTELSTPDNQKVIIPNGAITGNVITNVTAHPTRRMDLTVGVSYGDDLAKTRELLTKLLKDDARLLSDPAPTVAVAELGDSSVNFVVRPWVKTENYWPTRFALTEKIKQELDQAGVSIPFPQQDVHFFMERQEAP